MRELESPQQEHLGQIAQAQLVAEPPDQHLEDDVGRDFQEIELRAPSLVEGTLAVAALKPNVAQRGGLGQKCGF